MNRKLFNGLLLLTVAIGGVGTFTSCKDTEQEFRNDVLVGQQDLSAQIAAIRNLTDPAFKQNLDNEIDRLIKAGDFASAADLIALGARVDALSTRLDVLDAAYKAADAALKSELETKINTDINTLRDELKGYTDGKFNELDGRFNELSQALDGVKITADDALEKAKANALAIEGINDKLDEIEGTLGTLSGDLSDLKTAVEGLQEKYDQLIEDLGELGDSLDEYKEATDGRLDLIEAFNASVNQMFDAINQRFANLVTGLIVEQTYNPVFGTLNIPFGIQSNMLINYYAESDDDVTFPNGDNEFEYGDTEFSPVSLPIAAADKFELVGATKNLETLGNLYMTINPIQRNFAGLNFELVNSVGAALPGEFKFASCTDEVLKFGYTRSDDFSNPNGLYRASIVPAAGSEDLLIQSTKFEIEKGLVVAFKDAVKKHKAGDFVNLARAIYDQFDGVLTAYAAKVSWDDEESIIDENNEIVTTKITKSVMSGYDLAVACFRPLSYNTAFGVDVTDRRLPTFGSIKNIIKRLFDSIYNHIDLGIEPVAGLGDVTIEVKDIQLNIDNTTIKIEIPRLEIKNYDDEGNPIGSSFTEPTTITLGYDGNKTWVEGDNSTALNPLIENIQKAVKELIEGTDKSLINQINAQIRTKIIDVVNNMVDDINKQLEEVQAKINNSVKDIEDRVMAHLNGRLGHAAQSLVNLYNRFATKINDIIENPNAYLQIVMAYAGQNGDLHHLSTDASDPTVVGQGVLDLFLTSYNAEIIVPSYKKYVAITKVNGNKADAAVNEKAGKDLNKVLSGTQQEVAFDTKALGAGDYEIFYQSLDFRGVTSTRTYYIRVK